MSMFALLQCNKEIIAIPIVEHGVLGVRVADPVAEELEQDSVYMTIQLLQFMDRVTQLV